MTFAATLLEDRRLSILLVLEQTPGYSTNAYLLQTAIDQIYGHVASADQVKTDIAWLAEQQLVTVAEISRVTLAKLTARGADVAAGRCVVPGVKKRGPHGA